MKFYVSGPISGYPNKNREAFARASEALRKLGHTVLSPFELDLVEPCDPRDWDANMRRDIKYIPGAEGYLMLKGWEQSRGAQLEVVIASGLNIPLYRLNDKDELEYLPVNVTLEITSQNPSKNWN